MILNDYQKLIRENFDISDTKTRRCIIALEDTEQSQVLNALASALYDKIVSNVDKIDFGTIPRSRGDITKVDGFENTMECLNIMRKLVMEYRENPAIIDTVLTAVENIKTRKGTFMKAYAMNIELPMLLYNLLVLTIENCVSFLISVCIQYIKDPATESMSAALDKVAYNNTKDNLLYEQLVSFNNSCLNKEIDETLNHVIKTGGKISEGVTGIDDTGAGVNNIIINVGKGTGIDVNPKPSVTGSLFSDKECDNVPECKPEEPQAIHGGCNVSGQEPLEEELGVTTIIGGIVLGAGILSAGLKAVQYMIKALIPMLRNITYFFINTRVRFADSLAIQAQFIEANAYKLKYSDNSNLSDDKKEKVVAKQLKIAEKLKAFANKIAIDNKKAEKEAEQMAKEEDKKKKIDDLADKLPPDIVDKGGLF